MKTLLVYSSRTGNTKKVAEGIFKILPEGSKIASVDENPDPNDFDLILIGFWVDRGLPDKKAKTFMEKVINKKVGFFGTLGAYPDSDHANQTKERTRALLQNQENEIIAEFLCQGKIDERLTEKFKTLPPDHPHAMTEERMKRHEEAKKHPNEQDILKAQEVFSKAINSLIEGGEK